MSHTYKQVVDCIPLHVAAAIQLVEQTAKFRTLSMRVANRLCSWGGRLWTGKTDTS